MYLIPDKRHINEPKESSSFNETLIVKATDFCRNMNITRPCEIQSRNSTNLIIRDDIDEKKKLDIDNEIYVESDTNEDEDERTDNFRVERMQTITLKKDFAKADYVDPIYTRPRSIHQFVKIDPNRGFDTNSGEKFINFWNYDEINDLKMRFLSLLSTDERAINNYQPKRLSLNYDSLKHQQKLLSIENVDPKKISNEDKCKIESFFSSFGTDLYVANCLATLYTVSIDEQYANVVLESIVNLFMLNDLELADKHDWAVSHCGVPIWLLNTGSNPRRPHRQLKFTLAEKGTGFILWQDRIDYRSEFWVFQKKSTDSYSVYEPSQMFSTGCSFKNFLITFKASDRKTLVFIKFDFNSELLKFYDYYMQTHLKKNEENRQRARSLPIGVGNQISAVNKNTLQKLENLKHDSENNGNCKRYSKCSNNSIMNQYKYRKLSKFEISNPCSPRHIINVKISEKDSFYTLSKLLPKKIDTSKKSLSSLMSPSFSPSSSSTSSSSYSSA